MNTGTGPFAKLASVLQAGVALVEAATTFAEEISGQPSIQQSRGKRKSRQQQMPMAFATGTRWSKQQQGSQRRQIAHGYFIPTGSREEGQALVALVQEAGIGGPPQKLTLPIS